MRERKLGEKYGRNGHEIRDRGRMVILGIEKEKRRGCCWKKDFNQEK